VAVLKVVVCRVVVCDATVVDVDVEVEAAAETTGAVDDS
jgi:hypothetical protein